MQGAIIGYGTIGKGHFYAYQQMHSMVIKAIVDPILERRLQASKEFPNIPTYETLEALMDNEVVDFIDICSPPNTHVNYIRQGLINNCHILCEKPFLLSVEDYRGLLSLIVNSNRVIYPCHNYKFAPILQLIKRSAQSGNLGKIISGYFRTLRNGHAIGVKEWNPNWRRDSIISGGGILRDHGPHSIYMACDICNLTPIAVSAISGNLRRDSYQETEDTVLMTMYFADNLRFIIDLSWAAGLRNSFYAIYGTEGNMIVENDDLCYTTRGAELVRESLSSEFDDPSHKTWFVDMLEDFYTLTMRPDRQIPLLQEALVTSLVIEKAYESSKSHGKIIDIPYPSTKLL